MSSEGTVGRPHIDFCKLLELMEGTDSIMREKAFDAFYAVASRHGLCSLPIHNEILGLAIHGKIPYTRKHARSILEVYLREGAYSGEILASAKAIVESGEAGDSGFPMKLAVDAINKGLEEGIEILACMVNRDGQPPVVRDLAFGMLDEYIKDKGMLETAKEKLRAAIWEKEAKKEVSSLINLKGLMKPQGEFQKKMGPKRPEPAQEKVKRVARA